MILNSTVEAIEAELRAQLGGRIRSVWLELQENGNQLVGAIVLAESARAENCEDILEVGNRIVARRIPPVQGYESWMMGIKTPDGKLIDSIAAEIL